MIKSTLLSLLVLFLLACNEQVTFEPEQTEKTPIRTIKIDDDPVLKNLISNIFNSGQETNSRAIYNSYNELDLDHIVSYMNDNNTLNYSIPIENNDSSSQIIEYLKLANRNGEYFGYILQHEPTTFSYLEGFDKFTGIVRMFDLDGLLLSTEFILDGVQQSNLPDSLISNQRRTDVNCDYDYAFVRTDNWSGSGFGDYEWVRVGIVCDPVAGGGPDDGDGGGIDNGSGWGTPIDGGSIPTGGGDGGISGGYPTNGDDGDTFGFNDPIVQTIIYISEQINLSSAANTWLINNPIYANEIYDFLSSNNSNAAKAFAEKAIEYILDGTYSDKQAALLTFEMANRGRLDGPYDDNYFRWVNTYTSPNVNATPNLNVTSPSVQLLWVKHFARECAILKAQNPNMSDWDIYWEASRETLHLLLDLGGLVPVVGEVCDLTNAVIYTIEGDGLNASLSTASAVPFAGWIASGVKLGYKGPWRLIVKTNGDIYFGARNSKKFREALGLVQGDGKHAHHLIPWSKGSHPLIQKAAKSKDGFHLNETLNGIPLPSANHLTGHNAYTAKVTEILNEINSSINSVGEAYTELTKFINYLENLIKNNPNKNLGEIAALINY